MKIKCKTVHFHDDKIIDLPIVQEYYGYVGKNLIITEYIENAYEFKSLEEYIEKSKEKYKNTKFICVTKFSCFKILSYKSSTCVFFIELVK